MSDLRKKKVLVFHPSIAPYRIRFFNELYKEFETRICLYYENLKSQKFDYKKVTEKFEFTPDYFDRNLKVKKRIVYLGHKERILAYNPDVVIVGEYGEGLWSAIITRFFYRKKYKIITICDDSYKIAEECKGLRKISRDFGISFLDGIILCNDKAERWYREKFNLKIFVFPIIQDEHEFREDDNKAIELAREYINTYNLIGKRVFIFVGRVAPEKNIEYLVNSFLESHGIYPDNILMIIGGILEKDSGLLARIQKTIKDAHGEDYVIYLGRKEGLELKAWYFVGQVLVLPSIYERFGAVVNEALLSGEHVMVSENAGAACLVRDDNGVLINIKDSIIDFSRIVEMVKPINNLWGPAESRMPFLFGDKMRLLIEWIKDI